MRLTGGQQGRRPGAGGRLGAWFRRTGAEISDAERRGAVIRLRMRLLGLVFAAVVGTVICVLCAVTADVPQRAGPGALLGYTYVGDQPVAVAATSDGEIWTVGRAGAVAGLDLSGRVRSAFDLHRPLRDVAVDGTTVYLISADGVLTSFDANAPDRRRMRRVFPHPIGAAHIAAGPQGVWIVSEQHRWAVRVSPVTLRPTARLSFTGRVTDVVALPGAVWVALRDSSAVARIGRDGDGWRAVQVHGYPRPIALAYGAGRLWVAGERPGRVWSVLPSDRSGRLQSPPIPLGAFGPSALAVANGSIWVASARRDAVIQIGVSSKRRIGKPIGFGSEPTDIQAIDGAGLFVADAAGASVARMSFTKLSALRHAHVGRTAPPRQFGVSRNYWAVLAVLLFLLVAGLCWWIGDLCRRLRPTVPPLPRGALVAAVDVPALVDVGGPVPESWEYESAGGRHGELTVEPLPGAQVALGASSSHSYRGHFERVPHSRRIIDVLVRLSATQDLELDLALRPHGFYGRRLLHDRGGAGELIDAMRRRHVEWEGRIVYIKGESWTVERDGDRIGARLPVVWMTGERKTPVEVPFEARPTMIIKADQLEGDAGQRLLEDDSFNLDVLAVVRRQGADGRLELRMVALFEPLNNRLPELGTLRSGRVRQGRAGRARRSGGSRSAC